MDSLARLLQYVGLVVGKTLGISGAVKGVLHLLYLLQEHVIFGVVALFIYVRYVVECFLDV